MNLEYSGREKIAAGLDAVWAFVTDPTSVASCIPDAIESKLAGTNAADATVQFSVGPLRGRLTLRITLDPDAAKHHIRIQIAGGSFGSRVDVNAATGVTAVDAATTALDWNATVAIRGPVATVGGRGIIDGQAKRVISETFRNVTTRLASAPAEAG